MSKARQKTARRSYESPLRASQRDATRHAIVAAAHALMRSSPDQLTVPAIAARAGVSVPTVNRHFPSRQALLEGVVAHLDATARIGSREDLAPDDFFGPGLSEMLRQHFVHFAAVGVPIGANAAIAELRSKVTIPRRRKLVDDVIAHDLPTLAEPHRTWLSDLVVVTFSSAMVATMQSYLGHAPEENAKRVEWLLRALMRDAERLASPRASRSTANTKKKGTRA